MSLRVAAVELPHRYDAADAQWSALAGWMRARAHEVELAVLPEAALTGYISPVGRCDLSPFAEPLDGPTVDRARALAEACGMALVCPLIEREGARCYNASVLIDAKGVVRGRYRKRHPWYPEAWAAPGDLGSPVWALGGLRLGISVCFDLHFVEEDQGGALGGCDGLLFPSAWVEDGRGDSRGPRLGGLAKLYGLTVVNANWGRGVPRVPGQGGSRIVGPAGAPCGVSRVDAEIRSVEALLGPRSGCVSA